MHWIHDNESRQPRRAAPSKAAPPRGEVTRETVECGGHISPIMRPCPVGTALENTHELA
jgi:hypothetical protein